ncbi:hypothetical protein [Thalassococcus sp. S3]|uniref:hypothetical protein n=1 Tax=Thalassococcus sp. S3 TaxID=2017482 RepID=UPI0010244999|nr:hypothetical protein [Thalassococcus sp. S3]QBF33659.1 hypothetical protein CFI11_20930 [Thalassococcus sp. S3]
MSKFGPSKSDLIFRLVFSLCGLAMMVGAILYRGMPKGPAMFEIIGIASVFFGGTAVWTIRKLIRKDYSDGV